MIEFEYGFDMTFATTLAPGGPLVSGESHAAAPAFVSGKHL